MTAVQTRDEEFVALHTGGSGNGGVGAAEVGIQTAGATHVHLAFRFRVEVDEDLALHEARFQTESAGHAGLLVDGDEHLDGTVLAVGVGDGGQSSGHADAVVSTEGGLVGAHPAVVDDRLDGVGQEVVCLVAVGLRHHVAVRLQNHRRAVLKARGGGNAEEQVAGLVLHDVDLVLGGPFLIPFHHGGFVFGGVRGVANVPENVP